jgi:uncharacterized protein DUF3108
MVGPQDSPLRLISLHPQLARLAGISCLLSLLILSENPAAQQQPAATIGPLAQIVTPPANHRFPNGQTYVYAVEWHLFTAGTATVRIDPASTEQKVTATADSVGVANMVYTVRDRFEARFDPASFCSTVVTKHSEEGSHKRDTEIRFDYPNLKSILKEKNLKTGESKQVENDIPHCVTDVLSGFYYVASLPLKPGESYLFPLSDGGKSAEVTAHVEAKDETKLPAGTFHTLRVACEATSGNLKGRGKIWVWFTDDANRTPVQMRAKLAWGTLVFRLQRVDK